MNAHKMISRKIDSDEQVGAYHQLEADALLNEGINMH